MSSTSAFKSLRHEIRNLFKGWKKTQRQLLRLHENLTLGRTGGGGGGEGWMPPPEGFP